MKILITVSTYFPKKDGVQNVTGYLAEGLVKLGHNVTVLTSNKDLTSSNEEIYNGVKIVRINLYTKYGLYFGNKKEYKKIISEYANKVDVLINVCTQNAFTDLILKDLNKYKCKKILYKHDIFDFRFSTINFSSFASMVNKLWKEIRWSFYYSINGKYFKDYDVVTELHDKCYGYDFFEKKYGIRAKIIENAAENDFFEKKTLKDFVKPFDKYLLNVSNYDDRKNQKLAVREFLKANIDTKIGLVLIGSNSNKYYYSLINYANKLRKKYKLTDEQKPILMLHNIDRKYISSYVSNAYAYIMTSKWEAFPISLTESLASGVPFISTNVGIARFLFGGVTAYEINDIHYYIEKLCNEEKLRNDLSILAKKYAIDNLRIEDKVKELENLCKNTK